MYSNRIVELFPEREGSPDHWFFNDQGDESAVGTNTVPRSASVPPAKQLQSFVSRVLLFENETKRYFIVSFLQDPSIREIKEFISNDTFDVPDLHYIDNETQNDPGHLSNTVLQISEFNPHQFTSSSSKFINYGKGKD